MDDLISRQAAYDALMAEPLKWDDSSVWESARCHQWMMDMDVIKALPPAPPERKTGKWIDGKRMKFDGTFYWFRQCDQCGYERNDCDTEKDSNFCPDCGADMRRAKHERLD